MAARYPKKLHSIFHETLNPTINISFPLVWCCAPKWHIATFKTSWLVLYVTNIWLLHLVSPPAPQISEHQSPTAEAQRAPAENNLVSASACKKKISMNIRMDANKEECVVFYKVLSFTFDSAGFSTFAPVSECCPLRSFWWEPPSVFFWSAWPCWCPLNGHSVMFLRIKQYFKTD